jgi:hypothetical protein
MPRKNDKMKLPYYENAIVPEPKITQYLLNLLHQGGGKQKATFFFRFGFDLAEWQVMRDALLEHAQTHEVTDVVETPQGVHYVIEGYILSPDSRNPQIRTIWALDTDSTVPRLITAYPLK